MDEKQKLSYYSILIYFIKCIYKMYLQNVITMLLCNYSKRETQKTNNKKGGNVKVWLP